MIIRVLADNQYRVEDSHLVAIDQLDDEVMAAVQANASERYVAALKALVEYVHHNGVVVPDEEIVPSDAILPALDMTLEETREALEESTIKMPTE